SISYFFFQAEDGIRDGHVTGVQTCALPICRERLPMHDHLPCDVGKTLAGIARQVVVHRQPFPTPCVLLSGGETTVTVRGNGRGRSEERRVGKERRDRRTRYE